MLTHIALLGLSLVAAPRTAHHATTLVRPRIEVWSNHGDAVYTRSQGVRVYFRADQDGYVTLFRVDTDGRVRVLFPRDPWEDNFVRGGREYEALGSGSREAFFVDDYPGVGYLFAVVAADPFEYRAIESGNHWDYRTIADGRVRGDPYVALTDLAERIVPENYADWDYDIAPYYVDQHYDYPRFLCYDCHAYASYTYWDPYWRSCVRFRIVMYDDPYYYPYRYYGGRRVVFVRPFRPQPRFVFKDRDGSGRDQFVTREAQRPVNDDTRRTVGDRRSGVANTAGQVPAPRDGPRRERPVNDRERTSPVDRPTDVNRGGERRGTRVVPDNQAPQDRGSKTWERPVTPRDPVSRAEPRETPRETPRAEPRRVEPRQIEPRDMPRAEPRRVEPRETPRAEPQRTEPRAQPRAEPRQSQPRAQPKTPSRSAPKSKSPQGELRRRKP